VGTRHFVCVSGNVTDEVIAEYIRTQGAEPRYGATGCVVDALSRRSRRIPPL